MLIGVGVFTAFTPPLDAVRQGSTDDITLGDDVRVGEAMATIATLGAGLIIAALSGEWYPLVVALLTVIGMICLYETTLRLQFRSYGEVTGNVSGESER